MKCSVQNLTSQPSVCFRQRLNMSLLSSSVSAGLCHSWAWVCVSRSCSSALGTMPLLPWQLPAVSTSISSSGGEWNVEGFLALDVAGTLLQFNPPSQSLIPDLIYLVSKVKLPDDWVVKSREGLGGLQHVVCVCGCVRVLIWVVLDCWQSRERVGWWDTRVVPECSTLRPYEAGGGATTHQKLEVRAERHIHKQACHNFFLPWILSFYVF